MELFSVTGGKYGRLFCLGLLLLVVGCANGQQGINIIIGCTVGYRPDLNLAIPFFLSHTCAVGVSLILHGVTIPNNSLVEFEDTLYTAPHPCCNQDPTNTNGLHDQTLVCVTDLVDCCDTPMTVHGNWYDPDGNRLTSTASPAFRSNRGPYEVVSGRQFYGSVRIFRRLTPPRAQRGRFRCELPSAVNSNVNQILYAYIGEF